MLKKGNYYIDLGHSTFYNGIIKKRYENIADISKEIIIILISKNKCGKCLINTPRNNIPS